MPRPEPRRKATRWVMILVALIVLGIVTGLAIHFVFPHYGFIERLPGSPPSG